MKKEAIIILILFLIPFISAICEENQININTASLAELDKLTGIGPVKAQSIIDTRPFNTLDDLINSYGIGPATLQKIINQELACVKEESSENIQEEIQEEKPQQNPEQQTTSQKEEEPKQPTISEKVKLSPKDIKSEEDNKKLLKTTYAKYGFIIFCILLGTLLVLRKNKKQKTEFK